MIWIIFLNILWAKIDEFVHFAIWNKAETGAAAARSRASPPIAQPRTNWFAWGRLEHAQFCILACRQNNVHRKNFYTPWLSTAYVKSLIYVCAESLLRIKRKTDEQDHEVRHTCLCLNWRLRTQHHRTSLVSSLVVCGRDQYPDVWAHSPRSRCKWVKCFVSSDLKMDNHIAELKNFSKLDFQSKQKMVKMEDQCRRLKVCFKLPERK